MDKRDVRQRSQTAYVRNIVASCHKDIETFEKNGNVSEVRLKKKEIEAILKDYSLASWESFLESTSLVDRTAIPDLYSIFTFEPLHNLFLGVSKLLKHCMFQYLSSQTLSTKPSGLQTVPRLFSSVKTAVLRGCNSILSEFQRYYIMPGMKVDLSKHEGSAQLNGIFLPTGLRGMVEGKDYRVLDIVFPFVFGYADIWLGSQDEAPLTRIHVFYTDLVNRLMSNNHSRGWSAADMDELQNAVREFKKLLWCVFGPHCNNGLNTLKFHLLDHLVHDLKRFGSISVLSASPYEHFNYVIKQSYASTSKRLQTRTGDTVRNLGTALCQQHFSDKTVQRSPKSKPFLRAGLVQNGESLSFQDLLTFQKDNNHAQHSIRHPAAELLRKIHSSMATDAFPQLLELLKDHISNIERVVLPTMAQLQIVQSGYVHGGFVPQLSDCIDLDDGSTVIERKANTDNIGIRHRVFGIGWERSGQYKKQSFVVMRGEQDGRQVLWIGKDLLLFRLRTAGSPHAEEFAYVQYMDVTRAI